MRKRSWIRTDWENILTGIGIILSFLAIGTYMLLVVALLFSRKGMLVGIGVILSLVVICPLLGVDGNGWN